MIQLNTSDFEIELNNLYAISHIFVTAKKVRVFLRIRATYSQHFTFFVYFSVTGSFRGMKDVWKRERKQEGWRWRWDAGLLRSNRPWIRKIRLDFRRWSRYILTSAIVTRPAEKFWVVTPQTPLKFLGQNLFGDQFWSQSEARKVWPQATLCPRATPLSAP